MAAALSNDDLVSFNFVNYTISLINASAPVPLFISHQRLRFPFPGKRLPVNVLNKAINSF